jgi:hypothetical protein
MNCYRLRSETSHDKREVFVHSWYTSADVLAKVSNKVKRASAMEVLKIHFFEQGIDGEFRARVKNNTVLVGIEIKCARGTVIKEERRTACELRRPVRHSQY